MVPVAGGQNIMVFRAKGNIYSLPTRLDTHHVWPVYTTQPSDPERPTEMFCSCCALDPPACDVGEVSYERAFVTCLLRLCTLLRLCRMRTLRGGNRLS
ncbi:hypothetical protein MRX96_023233 [Rhipicephalus microplus]